MEEVSSLGEIKVKNPVPRELETSLEEILAQLSGFKRIVPFMVVDGEGKMIDSGNLEKVFLGKETPKYGSVIYDIEPFSCLKDVKPGMIVHLPSNITAEAYKVGDESYMICFMPYPLDLIKMLVSVAVHSLNNNIFVISEGGTLLIEYLEKFERMLSSIGLPNEAKQVWDKVRSLCHTFKNSVNSFKRTCGDIKFVLNSAGTPKSLDAIISDVLPREFESGFSIGERKYKIELLESPLEYVGSGRVVLGKYSFHDLKIMEVPFKHIFHNFFTNTVDALRDLLSRNSCYDLKKCLTVEVFSIVESGLLKSIGVRNYGVEIPTDVKKKMFKGEVTTKVGDSYYGGSGEGLFNSARLTPLVMVEFFGKVYRCSGLEYDFIEDLDNQGCGTHSFYMEFVKWFS